MPVLLYGTHCFKNERHVLHCVCGKFEIKENIHVPCWMPSQGNGLRTSRFPYTLLVTALEHISTQYSLTSMKININHIFSVMLDNAMLHLPRKFCGSEG